MLLRNGSVSLPTQNITVRDITAEARFTPGRIELVHLRANSNGRLEATGWLAMEGLAPGPFSFTVSGQNLRVADTRNLQMFASIQASVSGTPDAPTATGRITLERGSIHLEEFGETQVETVRLDDEAATWLDGSDLYRQLALDMRIQTDRNVWFRNRSAPEMQMELNGDLQFVKSEGGEAMVFGTMGTRQGHLSQLGKRFTLESGELVFTGDPTNPTLRIRTAYVLRPPHDITIRYRIGGTVAEPTFGYESEPQMELQDMVSYTLFNRPFNALMSWEQSMTNQGSLGTMAVDLLADRVGEFAAGALGLDVVQIDNSRSSGNSGMTIKAGSYVNDKLFIAILQEFGGTSDSQVIMEYALRQNLNVVLTGSDRRKSGIDIQWTYDY
jgi:autotransporter translocation and assembly factor TamB